MRIFLCGSESSDKTVRALERIICEAVPGCPLDVFLDLEDLQRKLETLGTRAQTVILVAAGKKEIAEFSSLQKLMDDIRIFLVLLEPEADTIAMGHKLRPRLLLTGDSDLFMIGMVLRKMARTERAITGNGEKLGTTRNGRRRKIL
jgi:hypothetical protein